MVKLVYVLRRRGDLGRDEFQAYWSARHAEVVRRHADALGIRRYVQSHTGYDQLNARVPGARGAMLEPYDGVAEVWWESLDDLQNRLASAAGDTAARALYEDERHFIDFTRSAMWLADEHVVIGS